MRDHMDNAAALRIEYIGKYKKAGGVSLRKVTRMKILVIGMALLVCLGYMTYHSQWFQKKYIYPFPYQLLIYQHALQYEVDPYLVAAVIRSESKFQAQARSPKGAVGLMQMMPNTAEWVAGQVEYSAFVQQDLENPDVNIRFGTWYLASLKKEFRNNETLMLAAYNGGRGNVKEWMARYGWTTDFVDVEQIPFAETKAYVKRVLASKARYQQLYPDD